MNASAQHSTASTARSAPRSFDAIVVGAGIVGLCAALLLARHHRSVALLAPSSSPFKPSDAQRFDPRVYAISAKSRRFLAGIKAWDAMPAERVTGVESMDIFGDDTRADALTLRARDSGLDAVTWIVEQQSLLDALEMAARFAPGLTRVEDRLQRMEAVGQLGFADSDAGGGGLGGGAGGGLSGAGLSGGLSAGLSGSMGGNNATSTPGHWLLHTESGQVLQAPVVLAADGANSAVRSHVLLDFDIEDYNAVGVVGTFQQERAHDGAARQWFLGSSVLALLPLPDRCVSLVWSMDAHQYETWRRDDATAWGRRVMQAADGRVAELTGRLDPCGAMAAYPLRHGVAPLWFADGVVLLGDAAHLVHPLAGQGLNIGIEDVADLESVITAGFSATSLRAWQRQRKAGAQPIHWLTHGLNGLFRVELPGVQWLRNTGMQAINQVPAIKRWLVGQAMR